MKQYCYKTESGLFVQAYEDDMEVWYSPKFNANTFITDLATLKHWVQDVHNVDTTYWQIFEINMTFNRVE